MAECYYATTCPTSQGTDQYLVRKGIVDAFDAQSVVPNPAGIIVRDAKLVDVVSINRSQSVPSPAWDTILMVESNDCQWIRDEYLE